MSAERSVICLVMLFFLSVKGPEATLVSVIIETGRTHQIRVHLDFIGHPIVGDQTYGRRPFSIPITRQFLHASYLKCELPNGNPVEVETPLPDDLQAVLTTLQERAHRKTTQ